MKDILEIILPKTLIMGIAEWMGYSFKAIRFYYYWSIPFCLLVFGGSYFVFDITDDNERLILAILGIYILTAIPATILMYKRETRLPFITISVNFAILETMIISDKDYLTVNFESARISEKQIKFFKFLEKKQPFVDGIVVPWLVQMPKPFYLQMSIADVKSYFSGKLGHEGYVAILIVSKEIGGSRIEFDVLHAPIFMNDQYLAGFWSHFNIAIIDQAVTEEYIIEVTKIFSAQMGQSVIDLATENGDFARCHRIIDDCMEIFQQSFSRIQHLLESAYSESLKVVEKDMLANLERYRAISYFNQREFVGGLRHLFKAIKLNPYFPYNRYEDFREAYNRKYVSAVAEQSKKIQEAIEESDDKEGLVGKEKFVHPGHDVDRISEFPFTQFYEELLTQVIQDADSQDVNDTILKHLSEAVVPEAFSLSFKGELYKYLPKGSKKYNLIYVDQIPEIIDFFEAALILDPDYVLLHGRIGTLMMILGMHSEEEDEQKTIFEAAFVRMNKAKETYSRLGYEIGPKL